MRYLVANCCGNQPKGPPDCDKGTVRSWRAPIGFLLKSPTFLLRSEGRASLWPPQRPTFVHSFSSGKGLGPSPTLAAGSLPRYESEPVCADAAAFASGLAPPVTVPRFGGNGS